MEHSDSRMRSIKRKKIRAPRKAPSSFIRIEIKHSRMPIPLPTVIYSVAMCNLLVIYIVSKAKQLDHESVRLSVEDRDY